MLEEPLAQLICTVLLYSVIPFLLSTLNNQSRTLYFYCYISVLFFLGGTLTTIYSIEITENIIIPGGSLAFSAFMMTTILFVMLQRELETIKNVLKLICGINIFIYLLFSLVSHILHSPNNSGANADVAKFFDQSMAIMLFGMVLICFELLLFVFAIEKLKKVVRGTIGIAGIYVIIFALLLIIDGIFFQYFIATVFEIPIQNLQNQIVIKLVLATCFSIPMVIFLFTNKAKLGMYLTETLDFSDLVPISKNKLLQEIEKQREVAQLTNTEARKLAERLSIAAESFSLGIWEVDLNTEKCLWDDKMYELYNTSEQQFSNTLEEWKSFIVKEDLERVVNFFQTISPTNNSGQISFQIKPINRKVKWIESHFKVFCYANKPVKMIGLNFDITERKRLEQLSTDIKLKDFTAKKSEAIRMLLGGIAHDFGNILLPLGGYAYEILESDNISEPDRANVNKIIDASNRADSLLKRIISLVSNHVDERRPTKIQDIVRDVCSKYSTSQAKHISWNLQLDEDCPSVLAPPVHLTEIVNQLCKNAVHAMREKGGELSIYVAQHEPLPDLNNKRDINPSYFVELIISDEGEGIEPEDLDKIFDPYFTTGLNKDGAGLGLTIVNNLVASLYGEVDVHSNKNAGTRVHVKLPAYTLSIR